MRRAFLALPLLSACAPQRVANWLSASVEEERRGIPYGPDPAQVMDLYGRADAPLLVFVHGGGWTAGTPRDYAFVARPLARLGWRVAVPGYRLHPAVTHPAFVEDVARACAALDGPLVLMGHSAGAFIAAALAYDGSWGLRRRTRGFIGLAGPYDFQSSEANPPAIFAGLTRVEAIPHGIPLGGAAPMLLLHGLDDTTVRPRHSRVLAARGRNAGLDVRHREYAGMGHVGIIAAFAAPVRRLGLADADVLGEVRGFLEGYASSS
ncbi:alpha/beta hydrolase [Roseococcus sp. DSY-14]|uniref:alpha/beta hydrolase n=1 Tax=Roseococcus sp. DSY-14 TaxID=3369650 RepID=UPI00387ADF13